MCWLQFNIRITPGVTVDLPFLPIPIVVYMMTKHVYLFDVLIYHFICQFLKLFFLSLNQPKIYKCINFCSNKVYSHNFSSLVLNVCDSLVDNIRFNQKLLQTQTPADHLFQCIPSELLLLPSS